MLTHKRTLVFLSVFVELMMTFCKAQKQKYVCIAAFLKEAGEPSEKTFHLGNRLCRTLRHIENNPRTIPKCVIPT